MPAEAEKSIRPQTLGGITTPQHCHEESPPQENNTTSMSRPNSPFQPGGDISGNSTEAKTIICEGCERGLTIAECTRCLACDYNLCEACVASPDTHALEHPTVKLSQFDDLTELENVCNF